MKQSSSFARFAKTTSRATGRPMAFMLACGVVLAWVISGPLFGFSDTWQLVINTGTTIVTFLMVFLIQNTQNRDAKAIHLKLDELLRALEPRSDWTSEVLVGRPSRELAAIAERRGAELVVVGRRRHGSMDRMLGNETPLQIMGLTSVPVLAVEAEFEKPHTIVAAIDFSPSSVRAAKVALQLLKCTGSGTLYLVLVEPPADLTSNEFKLAQETRFPGDVVVWFRRFIDSLGAHPGILTEPVVLNGNTVTAVAEFAERVGADMIAAGSHSHGRFERFLLGSVSTALVRNASCPVLVVPPCS